MKDIAENPRHDFPTFELRITSITFLLLLIIGIVGSIFHLDLTSPIEDNRAKQPFPSFSWKEPKKFTDGFDIWFQENFGFRSAFIHLNSLFHIKILRSPLNDQVVVGKEGWFFYNNSADGLNLLDHVGLNPSPANYYQWMVNSIKHNKENLAKRGIGYIVAIAPSKHTIYDEYLPGALQRKPDSPSTNLDELSRLLKQTDISFIDLREALFAAKDEGRLYFKNDSHWQDYGAFIAHLEIVKEINRIAPIDRILSKADFNLREITQKSGDLLILQGANGFFPEQRIVFEKKPETHMNPHKPAIALLSDSFGDMMLSFLNLYYDVNAVWYMRQGNSLNAALANNPKVIVQLVVERYQSRLGAEIN